MRLISYGITVVILITPSLNQIDQWHSSTSKFIMFPINFNQVTGSNRNQMASRRITSSPTSLFSSSPKEHSHCLHHLIVWHFSPYSRANKLSPQLHPGTSRANKGFFPIATATDWLKLVIQIWFVAVFIRLWITPHMICKPSQYFVPFTLTRFLAVTLSMTLVKSKPGPPRRFSLWPPPGDGSLMVRTCVWSRRLIVGLMGWLAASDSTLITD